MHEQRERASSDASGHVESPIEAAPVEDGPWVAAGPGATAMAERLAPPSRVLILLDERQRDLQERGRLGVAPENIVIGPARAGSALRVLLPFVSLSQRAPSAVVVALLSGAEPAVDDRELCEAVRCATRLARSDDERVFLMGSKPSVADWARSWAVTGPRLSDGTFLVESFVERPSPQRAQQLFERGALWAGPALVATVTAMLSLFERTLSVPLDLLRQSPSAPSGSWLLRGLYEATPPADFGYDVLQAAPERLRLVPVEAT